MMLDLDTLRTTGENQTVEFKASFSKQDEIIDTLVAFANAQGGNVAVGISPGAGHEVLGADIGSNTLEQFAVRLRERAGNLPLFRSEIVEYLGKKVAVFMVQGHRPGQLLLSAGCAWMRVASTNQKMTTDQIRLRILEDPELAVGCPRFQVTGGSSRNAKDEPDVEIVRTVEQVQGEFVESLEWRFIGPLVNPPMEWKRARVERGQRQSSARTEHIFFKATQPLEGTGVPNGSLAIELRFRWRGAQWYELHTFPFANWSMGREVLPSRMRREDTEWIDAS